MAPAGDVVVVVTEVGNEGNNIVPQTQEVVSQLQPAAAQLQPGNEARSKRPYNSDEAGFDMQEMLTKVNEVRENEGLNPLQINSQLIAAAQDHSQDQARSGSMSHTGSDGSDHSERAERVGYSAGNLSENVAAGADSVDKVMDMWVNSPGHLRNILDPKATEFGAANVDGFWTQLFGSQ